MKKNISKTELLFIIFITTFILISLAYYFVYFDILKTKEESVELNNALLKEKSRKSEYDSIRKNIKSTLDDHNRIVSIFIPQEGVVDFIQLLESLGKESGLSISTETVGSVASEDLSASNKEIISISLKTEGSFNANQAFLNYLENLPYKISITDLTFSYSDSGDSDTGTTAPFWKGQIKLEVIKSIAQI